MDQLDPEAFLSSAFSYLQVNKVPTEEWLVAALKRCEDFEQRAELLSPESGRLRVPSRLAGLKACLARMLKDWETLEATAKRELEVIRHSPDPDDLIYIHFLIELFVALFAMDRTDEVKEQVSCYASTFSVKKLKHGVQLAGHLTHMLDDKDRDYVMDLLAKALREKMEQGDA
ncbi:MAG: hypothetical protein JST35_07570 [Armatimonadetes bacterium]|nr:hypothetical protein [Armatimonadota bacterium]